MILTKAATQSLKRNYIQDVVFLKVEQDSSISSSKPESKSQNSVKFF